MFFCQYIKRCISTQINHFSANSYLYAVRYKHQQSFENANLSPKNTQIWELNINAVTERERKQQARFTHKTKI